MELLTHKEKSVLYRIANELAAESQDYFTEFPNLTGQEILQSIQKLKKLELIIFDKEIKMWLSSYKGENFIKKNENAFKNIKKEFLKNFNNAEIRK